MQCQAVPPTGPLLLEAWLIPTGNVRWDLPEGCQGRGWVCTSTGELWVSDQGATVGATVGPWGHMAYSYCSVPLNCVWETLTKRDGI